MRHPQFAMQVTHVEVLVAARRFLPYALLPVIFSEEKPVSENLVFEKRRCFVETHKVYITFDEVRQLCFQVNSRPSVKTITHHDGQVDITALTSFSCGPRPEQVCRDDT